MENSAVDALICPVCGLEFMDTRPGENALKCVDGHSFDIARQGYVNLLTGHGTKFAQDTAEMVAARDEFLDAGHYKILADALAEVIATSLATRQNGTQGKPLILDAGTGTGYYLQQILTSLSGEASNEQALDSIGLDISKFALRRAARRNQKSANLVWDLWQPLPLEASRADVVLVIFAPRNANEFARVLKPKGTLVIVTPRPQHLAEVAQTAGMLGMQPEKQAALVESMGSHFRLASSHEVTIPLRLSRQDIRNVALMGPAGHHLNSAGLVSSLEALPELTEATAAFMISIFDPRTPDNPEM